MPEKEQKKNSQKCDQEKYFSNVFKFWSKIPLYVKTMKMRFYISSGGPFKHVCGGTCIRYKLGHQVRRRFSDVINTYISLSGHASPSFCSVCSESEEEEDGVIVS